MKYNTLRIIRRLLKNELEGMELEVTALNKELKKADPDGQLPESDPKVKMRKAANDWRYELECALKDFDGKYADEPERAVEQRSLHGLLPDGDAAGGRAGADAEKGAGVSGRKV